MPLKVDEDNLPSFVGQPIWITDRLYPPVTPPGVVMGLAWTAMGGSVLFIECTNKEPLLTNQNSGDDVKDNAKGIWRGLFLPRVVSIFTTASVSVLVTSFNLSLLSRIDAAGII